MIDRKSPDHTAEGSFGEGIGLFVERSGDMSIMDVQEARRESQNFFLPAFYMDRLKQTLVVDPVYNDSGVSQD
jgi:hypothetical protein